MRNQINNNTKFYAVVGYYTNNGAAYIEEAFEDCSIKDLHKDISKNIYLDQDLTIHVAPSIEVRAFARNKEVFDELFAIVKDRDYLKNMLDCFSKHNGPSSDYIWTTIDLEEERQIQKEKHNLYF